MGPHNGWTAEQGYRESMRDLNQVRQLLENNPDLSGDVQQLWRDFQRVNPAYGNDAELSARIGRELLPEVERLELELRRKLGDNTGEQVRSAGSEQVPAGYADAIADYFRKLSKGK